MAAEQFRRALERLDSKIRNKIIKQAMKAALKPLAAKIKTDAPVDTSELKDGIKVKPGKRKKEKQVMSVDISTPDDNPHAVRVEWGSKDQKAKPFIRPAINELKDEMLNRFVEELGKAFPESK